MLFEYIWIILPMAFLLDLIFGDPAGSFHPVRLMGKSIEFFEPFFRDFSPDLKTCGLYFALFQILLTFIISLSAVIIISLISPVPGVIIQIILVYYCISAKSLKKAALEVSYPLECDDLSHAKNKLSWIVGRDVKDLDKTGAARAAVETVAENFVDGVVSPLFFAAIGGAPLALTYKMVNTLDSMVGYKNEKYLDFGRISAKIDDVANFIPSRLSVFFIAITGQIFSGRGNIILKTANYEGRNHSSPNAGFPEASFAGALGIKLGGPNYYHGNLVEKPYIGIDFKDVEIKHIKKACELMIFSSVITMSFFWLLIFFY